MVRDRSCNGVRAHLAGGERAVRVPRCRGHMAGSQANRTGRAGHVVGLAAMVLALGATARSQVPGQPGPATPGDAQAQDPSPPLPSAGLRVASFAGFVDSGNPPESMPAPTTSPQPRLNPGP